MKDIYKDIIYNISIECYSKTNNILKLEYEMNKNSTENDMMNYVFSKLSETELTQLCKIQWTNNNKGIDQVPIILRDSYQNHLSKYYFNFGINFDKHTQYWTNMKNNFIKLLPSKL